MTPAGRHATESAVPKVADHISAQWQGLNAEEKRILVHLLTKLRHTILQAGGGHVQDLVSPAARAGSAV